jgi:centromeric protein E
MHPGVETWKLPCGGLYLTPWLWTSVSVRVRPLNDQELEKGSAWKVEGGKITASTGNESSCYILDNVFDSTWTTVEVYRQTTKDIIKKVMGGINGTVFAYGQTSSGKTHTMRGTPSEPGIIPLAVNEIFDHIANTQDREFLLRVSYMEVS